MINKKNISNNKDIVLITLIKESDRMKKNSFLIVVIYMFIMLLSSCKDDNSLTVIDFGTAPDAALITVGSVEIITENTVRYHVINFTGAYTSTIVETEKGIVLVDVANTFVPNSGTNLRAYANAIGKSMSIIITHNHADHFGNLGDFTDVDVYAESSVATSLMATPRFTNLYSSTVQSVSASQELAGLEFYFGAINQAEAHINGYVYLKDHKAFFSGDLVYNKAHNFIREYTPLDSIDEVNNWITALNNLKNSYGNYKHIFVGHNGSRTDVTATIDENIAYLTTAQALIKGTKQLSAGGIATQNKEVTDELNLLYPNYEVSGLLFALPDAFFVGDPGAIWF